MGTSGAPRALYGCSALFKDLSRGSRTDTINYCISPQTPIGKSPAGSSLQIFFEREGLGWIRECNAGHQFPRFILARVFGTTVVVMFYSFVDIVGDADVALIGVGDAADQVDVFHGAWR